MKFVATAGGVPAGNYTATFDGVEPFTEQVDKYGEAVAILFRIRGGQYDGSTASRICSKKFSTKSNLVRFASALKGSPIAQGEEFDFASYKGVKGMLIVEATDSGGSRVSTFLRTE